MKVSTILDQIDMGSLALPKFQRGYVWKGWQVRRLMRSLYKGYPVGSLLVWETLSNKAEARGGLQAMGGSMSLLLDGQQRVTSLYGIIRGKTPAFFDGDSKAFLNLYFDVEEEVFEFYGPAKMKGNPRWVSVTELMQEGVWPFYSRFSDHPNRDAYVKRLTAIEKIEDIKFHIDIVSGGDKTIDVVVDIFNEVNSGGTKLSKGDLALAKISADWPEARKEMQKRLAKWDRYKFNLDWLLRCMNAILTGRSQFEYLDEVSSADIQQALPRAEKHIDRALNLIASRLGLDHRQVMGSPNAIPAIIRYFDNQRVSPNHATLDRLLSWYIHAKLWGRYSGMVETAIQQDLTAVDESEDAIGTLIERLRQNRGHLNVSSHDFEGYTTRNRFYPVLYMLTRVHGTRDLDNGLELKKWLLGVGAQLEIHHIFPKARLKEQGYTASREVNAVANFTFLTKITNLKISAKLPEQYFPEYESKNPGVLASHWIPEDPDLWKIENYRDFLAARRELLAKAANSFLDKLLHGTMPSPTETESIFARELRSRPANIASDEEEAELNKAMDWMASKGLPRGEYGYELVKADNEVVATLDLAWPDGIQIGREQAIALLIDEGEETLAAAQREGFRCFTDFGQLRYYVRREIIGE